MTILKLLYFPIAIILSCMVFYGHFNNHTIEWLEQRGYRNPGEPGWVAFKTFWKCYFEWLGE